MLTPQTGIFRDGSLLPLFLLSKLNDSSNLKSILSKFKENEINLKDSFGNSLLHYASYFRNFELVEYLL